jgi:MFS family permease
MKQSRSLAAARSLVPIAAAILAFGLARELWFRYLPEYLRFLGASAVAVGAFGALADLLDAAYAWPGGWLSDRLGHRNALLLFGGLTASGCVLYALSRSLVALFAGLFLVAAWSSLGQPAMFSAVGEGLTGAKRIAGFTAQAVLRRIPILIAPPLGGALITRAGIDRGMRTGFAASAVVSLAMVLVLWVAFRRGSASIGPAAPGAPAAPVPPADAAPSAPASRAFGPGLHPVLRRLLVSDVLVRLCEGLPDVFLVVWAIEVLHVSPVQYGVATSVLTATSILSYLPATALAGRVEKKPFVVATFLFFTLFPLAVCLARSFTGLLLAFAVGGLREIGEPSRKALILDLAPRHARGRTVGVYYAVRGFSVAGAAAVGGALWTIRPALTFVVAAALGAAGTAWAAWRLPAEGAGAEGGEETA